MNLKNFRIENETKLKLQTPMPDSIVKIKPGKGANSYVTGQSVIDKLNATFGYAGWSWEIVERWVEESLPKITKVRWENNRKVNLPEEEWVVEPQLPVAHVIGRLTVFFETSDGSLHEVSKMAPGAQPIVEGQSNQENCYKGAHTDAIKKAATMFGIALELYRDESEQEFFDAINYEDPWTEEAKAEHQEALEFLAKYTSDYQISDEDLANLVFSYSGETTYEVTPEIIESFVAYIKDAIESNNQE